MANFSTNWSDGKAFCAVIYDYNADDFKYQDALGEKPEQRLEYAFQFANDKVSVERLLDAKGMYMYNVYVLHHCQPSQHRVLPRKFGRHGGLGDFEISDKYLMQVPIFCTSLPY